MNNAEREAVRAALERAYDWGASDARRPVGVSESPWVPWRKMHVDRVLAEYDRDVAALASTPPPDEEAPVAWAVYSNGRDDFPMFQTMPEAQHYIERTDLYRVVPLYARHPAAKGEGASGG